MRVGMGALPPASAGSSPCPHLLPRLSLLILLSLSFLAAPALSYTKLSDASMRSLSIPQGTFDITDKEGGPSLLAPLLVPRVSGTEGNEKVQRWFLDFFARELPRWNVTTQTSHQLTPATGSRKVPFTNIIARREPPGAAAAGGASYLTLAAHFDSKRTPDGFIGATDSAAPCAMILHAARALDAALTSRWETDAAAANELDDLEAPQGVQLLLLDGEEAMVSWTHTDSLYGARALAEEWERPEVGNSSVAGMTVDGRAATRLGAISLFVLLDLLGSAQPHATVPSYFRTTHWAYRAMAAAERRLRDLKQWASSSGDMFLSEAEKGEADASARWLGGLIEDDHLPFMARGVEILHLIASPFPTVWHTMADDGEHLDLPTVEDWARLITAFTAEWMDLEGHLPLSPSAQQHTARDPSDEKSEL